MEQARNFKQRYSNFINLNHIFDDKDLSHFIYKHEKFFKFDTALNEWLTNEDYKIHNAVVRWDKACFITIAPSKYRTPIPYTEQNIEALKNFGENLRFLYTKYLFVVESGKYPDTPHLHIHILGIMRNSKKHLQQLRAKWEQLTGFTIDWKTDDYDCKQHRNSNAMPDYDEWIAEKISYMTDEYKGTHKNFEVLMEGPGGPGGF